MNPIYNYSDYRTFLRDRLKALKKADRSFTYTTFAAIAGFKSPGFLTQVLQGQSNLTETMALAFAKALGLGKSETDFFASLVASNQAKTHEEKSASTERLLSAKPVHIKKVEKAQFEFYKKWYYSAIRSVLGYYRFDGDYEKLGRTLNPPISAAEAKRAVKLLLRLGMVKNREDGGLVLTDQFLTTGADHQSVAVINYQLDTMELAKRAVREMLPEKRSAATLTLGVSAQGQQRLMERVAEVRKELIDMVSADSGIDRVVQINLHAFPLTAENPRET